MSLRIKLPAKTPELDSHSQASSSEASFKRKRMKRPRRVESDSSGEEAYQSPQRLSPTSSSPNHRRSHTGETGSDSEADTVAVTDGDSRFLPQSSPSTTTPALNSRVRKPSAKAAAYPLPKKKKRRVISESEEEYPGAEEPDVGQSAMDEDEYEVPQKLSAKNKGRAKVSGKKQGKFQHHSNIIGSAPMSTKRPRSGPPTKLGESSIDVVGDFEPEAKGQSPSRDQDTSPPPKKRPKLPTIKKNKNANPAGPLTPSTSIVPKSNPTKIPILDTNQPPITGIRKTPATVGNTDFDLRNANVYRELFKTTGGSTPRSGLNRREKDEERRKELNKMRDEARAKRSLEAKQAFDLQEQTEKISRFEDRLKRTRSSALYPNFLAAKWRELWEQEKKKAENNRIWTDVDRNWASGTQEEGEATE